MRRAGRVASNNIDNIWQGFPAVVLSERLLVLGWRVFIGLLALLGKFCPRERTFLAVLAYESKTKAVCCISQLLTLVIEYSSKKDIFYAWWLIFGLHSMLTWRKRCCVGAFKGWCCLNVLPGRDAWLLAVYVAMKMMMAHCKSLVFLDNANASYVFKIIFTTCLTPTTWWLPLT